VERIGTSLVGWIARLGAFGSIVNVNGTPLFVSAAGRTEHTMRPDDIVLSARSMRRLATFASDNGLALPFVANGLACSPRTLRTVLASYEAAVEAGAPGNGSYTMTIEQWLGHKYFGAKVAGLTVESFNS
jgi:hypothetical protein